MEKERSRILFTCLGIGILISISLLVDDSIERGYSSSKLKFSQAKKNEFGDSAEADCQSNPNSNSSLSRTVPDQLPSLEAHLNASTWISMERGRLCPELMAASRYMVIHAKRPLPKLRFAMTQLVGQWNQLEDTLLMMQVFQHNRKIFEDRLNISSFPILKPPSDFENSTQQPQAPAFWKMLAVKDLCLTGDYDVVLFLDGDVIITDPSIPVEALWHFYAYLNPQMDVLFGVDINGINSGIFMTNCQSNTAMDFLQEWHVVAPRIAVYSPLNFEQSFLQYVLETDSFWMHYIPRTKKFKNNPMPRWDNFSQQNLKDPQVWSTQRLRERLQRSSSQCVFSGYPVIDGRAKKKGFRTYLPGDVAVHMAGLKASQKVMYTKQFLSDGTVVGGSNDSTTTFSPTESTAAAAAMRYLQTHLD